MTITQFEISLDKIENLLFGFAMRLTRNRDEAKDLMQETLLKAYDKKERFQLNTNFKAWVTTIMYNSYISQHRKKKNRRKVELPADSLDKIIENKSSNNNIVSNMTVQEIKSIIRTMSDNHKVPFLMHYRGYQYDEIAKMMDLPIGTIKSRIFHARKELKTKINQFYGSRQTA